MKEFLLVFRSDLAPSKEQPTPEQYQAIAKQWQDWMGKLVVQNNFGSPGKRLSFEGKVVRGNSTITNGPYVEVKEGIQGYMFIMADNIDQAAELAKGCPVLTYGGSVEVRPIVSADGKS